MQLKQRRLVLKVLFNATCYTQHGVGALPGWLESIGLRAPKQSGGRISGFNNAIKTIAAFRVEG